MPKAAGSLLLPSLSNTTAPFFMPFLLLFLSSSASAFSYSHLHLLRRLPILLLLPPAHDGRSVVVHRLDDVLGGGVAGGGGWDEVALPGFPEGHADAVSDGGRRLPVRVGRVRREVVPQERVLRLE